MERKHLSQQIGQILDDLARLSNTLYAMGTADIQRYPDNYEVLSTDAALRAEKIACERFSPLSMPKSAVPAGKYLPLSARKIRACLCK